MTAFNCKVEVISATFREESWSDATLLIPTHGKKYIEPEGSDSRRPYSASKEILNELRRQGLTINPTGIKSNYYIEFVHTTYLYSNKFELAWMYLSDLGAWLLPSYTSGNMSITAIVRNSEGQEVGTYMSDSVEFKWARGWIFAPFNFLNYDLGPYKIKHTTNLTNNLLQKMKEKRALCSI